MDRVVLGGLGQRKLVRAAGELVAAIGQAVGPRKKRLPLCERCHLAFPVAVEHGAAGVGEGTHAAADLDDGGAQVAGDQLHLSPRRGDRLVQLVHCQLSFVAFVRDTEPSAVPPRAAAPPGGLWPQPSVA